MRGGNGMPTPEAKVKLMRELRAAGRSTYYIADRAGVSRATVRKYTSDIQVDIVIPAHQERPGDMDASERMILLQNWGRCPEASDD